MTRLTLSLVLAMILGLTYPGGKNGAGIYQTIINQMPPHEVYIEPFLGSGAVLRMKKPARLSIGLDRDESAIGACLAECSDARSLTLIHGDGIRYLQERRWGTGELVYADPPYLMSARKTSRSRYQYELTEQDHVELLATLKTIPAMVIVSGYASALYMSMLERWRFVTFQAMTRGGTLATECLWMNYPEPAVLHDYRFLGRDFRERERITRRVKRWQGKLAKMPVLERQALLSALGDGAGDTTRSDERRRTPETTRGAACL